jgi:hypothetical protein
VSDLDRERARALCLELLAACQPGGSGQTPVTDSFRCWTPVHDWATGADGLSALRHVLGACAATSKGAAAPTAHAVISDGETVVIETDIRAKHGGPQISYTFVLGLQAGLVDDVRCYFDPRVVEG